VAILVSSVDPAAFRHQAQRAERRRLAADALRELARSSPDVVTLPRAPRRRVTAAAGTPLPLLRRGYHCRRRRSRRVPPPEQFAETLARGRIVVRTRAAVRREAASPDHGGCGSSSATAAPRPSLAAARCRRFRQPAQRA